MIHINRVAFTTVPIILLAGTFLLNLASCGTVKGYAGDTRPAADVATLRANPFWSDILVTVTGGRRFPRSTARSICRCFPANEPSPSNSAPVRCNP